MKAGKSLTELAVELERQQDSKRDFIADTRQLHMTDAGDLELALPCSVPDTTRTEQLQVTRHTHGQLASRLKVPKKYYDRMLADAPALLATNVNHWFDNVQEKRLVRTMDGRARAFLSSRYRILDGYDLAQAVLPVLQQHECKIVSCELTETKMYIKAINYKTESKTHVGQVVAAGVIIRCSEIGSGGVCVDPLIETLACMNGMVVNDASLRKYHTGRNMGADGDGVFEVLQDETKAQSDKAFWLTARDVTAAALSDVVFKRALDRIDATQGRRIEADPVEVIRRVSDGVGLSDEEQGGVLRHLIEGGDLSQWGVISAITRTAQDIDSYDRSTDLEVVGGQLLDITDAAWESYQKPAAA